MREFCSITITGLYRSKGPSGIFDAVSAYDHHISMARGLSAHARGGAEEHVDNPHLATRKQLSVSLRAREAMESHKPSIYSNSNK